MADKGKVCRPGSLALLTDISNVQQSNELPVFSPMTELAMIFQENCNSYSSTPRRRLSLSDIASPSPLKGHSKSGSVESGIFVDYSGDTIDSPTLDECRLRCRKSSESGSGPSLRRQAVFRRCNSLQTAGSRFEPLSFKLTDDERSPRKKAASVNEDNEIVKEIHTIGLPDDLKCTSENDDSIMNRSLSAPPVLDSIERYFTDLDGESNSPKKTDGFDDFLDQDPSCGMDESMPTNFKGLLGGTILNKKVVEPKKRPRLSRSESDNNKENLCSLQDQENVIYENKPLVDAVFPETVFKRPSQLIRKIQKRSVSLSVKRTDSQRDFSPVSTKRIRYRSQSLFNPDDQFKSPVLQPHNPSPLRLGRSLSVGCEDLAKDAALKAFGSEEDANLTGDKLMKCCLPRLEKKQHQDLNAISPETLCAVINKEYQHIVDEALIIDCRYPYEYNGGHIKGAINIYTKEDMIEKFLKRPLCQKDKRLVIIFHCEFSSKRAPSLNRFLRNKDRDIHKNCYPHLYYPELYYLEGGYKAFFHKHKELCEPQEYLKMEDEKYSKDLKHFAKRSKSWSEGNNRMRTGLRY